MKKAMAEEVTRPVGDGLAEGDVYVPPDWLRTGGAGEPERSQGSDVATGTKANLLPRNFVLVFFCAQAVQNFTSWKTGTKNHKAVEQHNGWQRHEDTERHVENPTSNP